jgi:hypothetical protein
MRNMKFRIWYVFTRPPRAESAIGCALSFNDGGDFIKVI